MSTVTGDLLPHYGLVRGTGGAHLLIRAFLCCVGYCFRRIRFTVLAFIPTWSWGILIFAGLELCLWFAVSTMRNFSLPPYRGYCLAVPIWLGFFGIGILVDLFIVILGTKFEMLSFLFLQLRQLEIRKGHQTDWLGQQNSGLNRNEMPCN